MNNPDNPNSVYVDQSMVQYVNPNFNGNGNPFYSGPPATQANVNPNSTAADLSNPINPNYPHLFVPPPPSTPVPNQAVFDSRNPFYGNATGGSPPNDTVETRPRSVSTEI